MFIDKIGGYITKLFEKDPNPCPFRIGQTVSNGETTGIILAKAKDNDEKWQIYLSDYEWISKENIIKHSTPHSPEGFYLIKT